MERAVNMPEIFREGCEQGAMTEKDVYTVTISVSWIS